MSLLKTLQQNLTELGNTKLCLAFSGGVDSTLLLKVIKDMGIELVAVTFQTFLHPHGDIQEARSIAEKIDVVHHVITIDELTNPQILQNPPDRCYHCKHMLFTQLTDFAVWHGCDYVLDGTNADDLKEYRPGLRALAELNVRSPLAECGFTKGQIRELAATLGLRTATKPAAPCLATRLPYGTTLTATLLRKIEEGEKALKHFGFYNLRLRVHGELARIEVDEDSLWKVLEHREEIISVLQKLGFAYITMDLLGFRSGSYDKQLEE